MNISKIIQWMKGNPIIVASLGIALLCMAFVAFITFFVRSNVVRQVEKKVAQQTDTATKLMAQKITVPGRNPGDKMKEIKSVTISPSLLRDKKIINERYHEIGTQVRELTQKRNSAQHEANCILPTGGLNSLNVEDARVKYRNSFEAALWNPKFPSGKLREEDRKSVNINPLFAAPPHSEEELQVIVDNLVKSRVQSFGASKLSDLSPTQQQTIQDKAHNAIVEALRDRAANIGVYAEKTQLSETACPFGAGLVRDWGHGVPSEEVAYESQADLWILRDIVDAIRAANHIGEEGRSVLNGPVKRLLRLQINRDGYVGMHTMGWAVGTGSTASSGSMPIANSSVYFPAESMPQVENFFASPTGRVSNSLYDVKHARLDVLVDVQRLPELFEALDGINAMTVLDVDIDDVDEYKELRDGHYYYGKCDVVRASILVETIWMRSWTVAKMPAGTKKYLNISTGGDPAAATPVESAPSTKRKESK